MQYADQILAELIQERCRTVLFVINNPNNYIWNKEELPNQWNRSWEPPTWVTLRR
jgi:hypothetical protein